MKKKFFDFSAVLHSFSKTTLRVLLLISDEDLFLGLRLTKQVGCLKKSVQWVMPTY